MQRFTEDHPGTVTPAGAERNAGLSGWVGVQHFLNLFLTIFIVRSGIQILSDHPRLYWTRHSTPGRDWFRAQKPVPADPLWTAKQDSISLPGQVGLPGIRHSIGLARWWHLGTDTLRLLNGLVFCHLTMLAYDMNGEPLPYGHGAPLRLRNEVHLGFKQVKWNQGRGVRRGLLRDRRRPRRLQPGPRVLRLPAVHLAGHRLTMLNHEELEPHRT